MIVEVRLIQFGMAMQEGTVVRWLCSVGDAVTEGQTLLELETEKATAELPSPTTGTLASIDAVEGDVIPVGGRLGSIAPS